jgi:hypothetical protein
MYAAMSCSPVTSCSTCESLRAAALHLVGEQGLDGLSRNRLCEACELTKAEFGDHYANARECLYDAYREVSEEMLLEISAAFDASATWHDAVTNVSARALARFAERPDEARLMFVEALRGDRELRLHREHGRQRMVALFVAEHRRHSEVEHVPQVQVEMLLGASFHLIASQVADGRIRELPELSAELAQLADMFEPIAAAA